MDAEDLRLLRCPVCDERVEDYAPGVSSVVLGRDHYHPACAERVIENTPKPLTAPELMRVREIVPEPNAFLPETDRPRRWFDVFDGNGQRSLVLSGGLFIAGALYCDRHELVNACECTARVRLSGLLERKSDLADLGKRMAFQLEVVDVLTHGINATRATTPALDEKEEEEMYDAFESGQSARDFALRLCNRDVGRWEAATDPYPDREFPTAEND